MTGDAPLTPVQHWLLDTPGGDPAHFSQTVAFELATDPDEGRCGPPWPPYWSTTTRCGCVSSGAGTGGGGSTAPRPAKLRIRRCIRGRC
ncbi:hypothetical protein LT493_15475 [Streptomyces tricolor]|nr:hypothetical protein [Streptomyces tricolor]